MTTNTWQKVGDFSNTLTQYNRLTGILRQVHFSNNRSNPIIERISVSGFIDGSFEIIVRLAEGERNLNAFQAEAGTFDLRYPSSPFDLESGRLSPDEEESRFLKLSFDDTEDSVFKDLLKLISRVEQTFGIELEEYLVNHLIEHSNRQSQYHFLRSQGSGQAPINAALLLHLMFMSGDDFMTLSRFQQQQIYAQFVFLQNVSNVMQSAQLLGSAAPIDLVMTNNTLLRSFFRSASSSLMFGDNNQLHLNRSESVRAWLYNLSEVPVPIGVGEDIDPALGSISNTFANVNQIIGQSREIYLSHDDEGSSNNRNGNFISM